MGKDPEHHWTAVKKIVCWTPIDGVRKLKRGWGKRQQKERNKPPRNQLGDIGEDKKNRTNGEATGKMWGGVKSEKKGEVVGPIRFRRVERERKKRNR